MSSILMDNQTFNNEVAFCTVYTRESKSKLEEAFLKNRISYYCEWQDKNFIQRLLNGRGGKNRINCVIRINNAEVERARALVVGIPDIKLKENGDSSDAKEILVTGAGTRENKAGDEYSL